MLDLCMHLRLKDISIMIRICGKQKFIRVGVLLLKRIFTLHVVFQGDTLSILFRDCDWLHAKLLWFAHGTSTCKGLGWLF